MEESRIILFDCDGTLVDSEELSSAACVEALAQFGIHYSEAPFKDEFIGMHLSQIVHVLNARHGTGMGYDEFVGAYTQRMRALVPGKIRILPETKAYIEKLHARGHRLAVGSNGVREIVLAELEHTGILKYFDVVITADDVPNPKPAPDMYLEGMRFFGEENPESVFVLEDSVAGLRAGLAAKMISVGYVGLSHAPEAMKDLLMKSGAKQVLTDLSQLDLLLD